MAKKIKVKETEKKWILVNTKMSSIDQNYVSVAFSEIERKKGRYAYIKIGNEVLEKMGWKIGETISVFHEEDDIYSWMVCKTERGRKLSANSKSKSALVSLIWNKPAIPFNAATQVNFKTYKDKIILEVKKL